MRRRVTYFLVFAITVAVLMTSQGFGVLAQGFENSGMYETRELPGNPLHSCHQGVVSADTTLWDYVYFGNYPQSEVTDAETIAEIEKTISENNICENETSGEPGVDVLVGDIKYRRISESDRNCNYDDFGTAMYRYFQWEPIKWKVLRRDENSLFLMTDQGIDCKKYHETGGDITWEECSLRSWLNGNFYATAFSGAEQNAILEQTLANEYNGYADTDAGNDTVDKVYLLSLKDTANTAYGFCSNPLKKSAGRWQQVSDYSLVRGVRTYRNGDTGGNRNCWWWTRTPGENQKKVVVVWDSGDIGAFVGRESTYSYFAVCPVIKMDLQSSEWTLADDGSNGEGKILTGLQATISRADYPRGATVNVKSLKVTATYSFCSKTYDVPLLTDSFTTNIEQLDMNTPGEKTLTVTYCDRGITKTADVSILVEGSDPGTGTGGGNNSGTGTETGGGNNSGTGTETGGGNSSGTGTETGGGNNSGTGTETGGGNSSGTGAETGGRDDSGTTLDGRESSDSGIKITKLVITAPSTKLAAGKKVKLAVKVYPENASEKEIIWKSSNENYATVDKNGKVSLKEKGAGKQVIITAEATDGSGVKTSYGITVMKHAVKSIKIDAPSKTLKSGKSMKLHATVKTTGRKANVALRWVSSHPAYVTVSKSGKIKAKKAAKGKTVTITALSTDGTGKKAKIKVKIL